jgi:ferredoxin
MVVALLEQNELPWSIMEQIWIRIAIFRKQSAGNDLFCVGSAVFCIGSGVCEVVCLSSLKDERMDSGSESYNEEDEVEVDSDTKKRKRKLKQKPKQRKAILMMNLTTFLMKRM